MDSIQVQAYAKINLTLDVVGRRPDGYHDIRSVMQTVSLCDRLTLTKTAQEGIFFTANDPTLPAGKGNLAYDAAALFFAKTGLRPNIEIQLEKHIPTAAGLAGGSSDAAATLRGLNVLYNTGLTLSDLQALGVTLGADIPYCLAGGTMLAEGIGERLTPLPAAPTVHCLLVKPPIGVSTKQVYESLHLAKEVRHPDVDAMIEALRMHDAGAMCALLGNLLQQVTEPLHPEIGEIKETLRSLGADGVLMSGSGPTVFALFTDAGRATAAYRHFQSGPYAAGTHLAEFITPAKLP